MHILNVCTNWRTTIKKSPRGKPVYERVFLTQVTNAQDMYNLVSSNGPTIPDDYAANWTTFSQRSDYRNKCFASPHILSNGWMFQAGLNVSSRSNSQPTFTGHLTRSAATSKAADMGLPLEQIQDAADWSSASTFERFYHKPNSKGQFAHSILGSAKVWAIFFVLLFKLNTYYARQYSCYSVD